MGATIKDVARRAGVAVSTVSLVVNGKPHVSPETRERVLEAIRALDYRPNVVARRLVTSEARCVAAIVPNIANPFYGRLVSGVQRVIRAHGYDLMLYDSEGVPSLETAHLKSALRNRVDGVLMVGGQGENLSSDRGQFQELLEMGIKIVSVERELRISGIPEFLADKKEGAFQGVSHLISAGHSAIGFIGGYLSNGGCRHRLAGYRDAMSQGNLSFDERMIRDGRFTCEGGYEAAITMLRDVPEITAIFAANDLMALGVYRAARDLGLLVPDDLSVVGFDDVAEAQYYQPPLTTVSIPIEQMGTEATELLLAMLTGGPGESGFAGEEAARFQSRTFPTRLILRDSVAFRNHGALERPGATN